MRRGRKDSHKGPSFVTIEQTILTLPSVRRFIDSVTNSLRYSSVVVLIPDTISREMVARLIDNGIGVQRLGVGDVSYTADQVPVLSVSDQLNISWPSPSTIRNVGNLLQCEGLPNLIHIRDFNTSESVHLMERARWLDLARDWASERRLLKSRGISHLPQLCFIAKLKDFDFAPPSPESGLAIHWWWGLPPSLEVRLACRIANEEEGVDEVRSRWREQVLPALVSNDWKLADHLWDDIFKPKEDVVHSLIVYAGMEDLTPCPVSDMLDIDVSASAMIPPPTLWGRWASGQIVFTPEYGAEHHPATLASVGRLIDVEYRLWRGQSECLLPILNGIRINVCDHLTATFGHDWPTNPYAPRESYELEAVTNNPRGAGFGYIEHLLSFVPKFEEKRELLPIVSRSRLIRNEIAHYRAVSFGEFSELWKETERLNLT